MLSPSVHSDIHCWFSFPLASADSDKPHFTDCLTFRALHHTPRLILNWFVAHEHACSLLHVLQWGWNSAHIRIQCHWCLLTPLELSLLFPLSSFLTSLFSLPSSIHPCLFPTIPACPALLCSPILSSLSPCSGGEVDLEAFLQGSVWYVWYIRLLFCPTIYQTYSYSVLLCLQTCVCSVYDLFMNVCVFGASDRSICVGGIQGVCLRSVRIVPFPLTLLILNSVNLSGTSMPQGVTLRSLCRSYI